MSNTASYSYLLKRLTAWSFVSGISSLLLTQNSGAFIFGIFVGIGMFCFFMPYYIAGSRKHPNKYPILAINLFLGWSLIGWVIALVWALTRNPIIH
jgi:hypothetical protein